MEDKFNYFVRYLIEACSRIDQHYFQLAVAGYEEAIYRERVYCYELYHQLRCILGDIYPYKLNGEVDKIGHPIIHQELGAKKPDFIVHVPGGMNKNLVVIEVKSVSVNDKIRKLRADLETLKGFLNKAGYYRAIMLVYGNIERRLPCKIQDEIKNVSDNRVIFIWHAEAKTKPEVIQTS